MMLKHKPKTNNTTQKATTPTSEQNPNKMDTNQPSKKKAKMSPPQYRPTKKGKQPGTENGTIQHLVQRLRDGKTNTSHRQHHRQQQHQDSNISGGYGKEFNNIKTDVTRVQFFPTEKLQIFCGNDSP